MLERIGSWWTGKILVLVLLGFAATDFLITMTLAAADTSTPAGPGHPRITAVSLLAYFARRG